MAKPTGKKKVTGPTNIYISDRLSELLGEIDFDQAGLSRTITVRIEMLEEILSSAEKTVTATLSENKVLACTSACWSHCFGEEAGQNPSPTEVIHNVYDSTPDEINISAEEHVALLAKLKKLTVADGFALNRIIMRKKEELAG